MEENENVRKIIEIWLEKPGTGTKLESCAIEASWAIQGTGWRVPITVDSNIVALQALAVMNGISGCLMLNWMIPPLVARQ